MKRFWRSGFGSARTRGECAALLVAVFAGAGRAEEAKPVRVSASHRVDVIAPGERVETAIDRMRRSAPLNLPPRLRDRLAPRPPSERAVSEHAASDRAASERSDRAAADRGTDRSVPSEPQKGAVPAPGAPAQQHR